VTLGAGPYLAYHLIEDAERNDCLVLTRLWLSDELPVNAESRVIGIVTRLISRYTNVKFLVSYADPVAGTLVSSIKALAGYIPDYHPLCHSTILEMVLPGIHAQKQ